MRCFSFTALLLFATVITPNVLGQEGQPKLTRTFAIKPKAGHAQEFEEAVKEHVRWIKDNDGPWAWHTWTITTGPRLGYYLFVSPGHSWEDFDTAQEFHRTSQAHWQANVSQYVESAEGGIYRLLEQHSRVTEITEPDPIAELNVFYLKPGGQREFLQNLSVISGAMNEQESAPTVLWQQLVNGGEPNVVMVRPIEKFADWRSPEMRTAWESVTQELGQDKIQSTLKEMGQQIQSQRSELLMLRRDLSYAP